MMERRRTERVFLQIPISVQGQDQSGNLFAERTSTIEVNRNGARVGLKNSLRVGDEVRVTNLATSSAALFRVAVQCPQNYGDSTEWGLALSTSMSDLMTDFWGVTFEDLPEAAQPHISALLVCQVCGRQELVTISHLEYDVLRHELVLPRICQKCRTATDWEPADLGRPAERSGAASEPEPASRAPSGGARTGDVGLPDTSSWNQSAEGPTAFGRPTESIAPPAQEDGRAGAFEESGPTPPAVSQAELARVLAEPAAGPVSSSVTAQSPDLGDKGADQTLPAEPAAQGADRRGARRVPVRVPILVMVPNGATEETFTRDVSKTGLSFPTTLDISQGDSIEVIVGHGVVAHPTKQRARVARRIPETRGVKALVGAQFTGPQE